MTRGEEEDESYDDSDFDQSNLDSAFYTGKFKEKNGGNVKEEGGV